MLKRMMLLAVAALATMAFAVPAVAAASNGAIYDVETSSTLGEGKEITLSGFFGFEGGWGGFPSCGIDGTLTQGAAASSVGVSFTVVPGCTGVGVFVGCELVEASGSGAGVVTGHDIDVEIILTQTNNSKCGSAVGFPGSLEHFTHRLTLTLQPGEGSGTSLDCLALNGSDFLTTALGSLAVEVSIGSTIGAVERGTWAIETL